MDDPPFGHDFPVWYLVAADAPGGPVRYATFGGGGTRWLPVFTDEDLAAGFRPTGAGPLVPVAVRTPAALAALLRGELAGVVSHVAYDLPPPGSGRPARWVLTAADVIAACEAAG